jgi:hypothetical protein
MAPRWIKTKQFQTAPWTVRHPDDDWLLVSGDFVVGRVFREATGPHAGRIVWKLTGLHGLTAANGVANSIEDAQEAVRAGWREWQAWAGVRDA